MSCLHPSTTHIRGTTSAVTAAPVQRRGSVNSEQMEPRVQPTTGEPELEAVLGDDADPQAMFASMYKNFAAFKKRLNSFDDRLTVNTSICLKSNYFFSWLRSVSLEVVLETEADDGWGTVIAERDNEMIAVFGTCSHHTEAREATASFSWEEALPTGERSTRRKRGTSGSDGPPPPKDTKIVARTGSFVVFEHKGMYVRGLALYFLLYLPPKGNTPTTLTEFRGQVVLLAYVYVALLDRNCLVVRVQPAARSLPAPAHEPLLTAQAVYTSKQVKLDCLPEGRVLDYNHIKAWNTHVHPTITEEAVLDNAALWADVIGRRDMASSLAHTAATIQRASEDLKKLGFLTNSLPIHDVDAEGADVDAEGANDIVQLQVTVHPDKIREFIIHCRLGEAPVAHEWAVTALASVRDFDYKTSSLPKYTISSVWRRWWSARTRIGAAPIRSRRALAARPRRCTRRTRKS